MEKGGPAVERMRQVYDRRRQAMANLLRNIGFGIPVLPDGAFYIFADASRFTENSHDFAFELLEKAGVAVTPGVDFGEAGRRSIRFTYANSEENIREAARRLGEYLGKRGISCSPRSLV
jgi:aspartate/methionine/tyrosine aminotransferase